MSIKNTVKKILGRDKLQDIEGELAQVRRDLDGLSKDSVRKKYFDHEVSGLKTELSSEVSGFKEELKGNSQIMSKLIYTNLELLGLPETKKKKVLITGFYGAPNLGDELMLETLLQYFEERKDIQITIMLCDNADYDISRYKDINFIHYPRNIFEVNSIAGYFDTVVFGGGAVIDDTYYDKSNPNYDDLGTILIDLSAKVIRRGKDLYCISLSSNKALSNKAFIEGLSFIVKHAKHFSIRDENSIKTLKDAGLSVSKSFLSNDIVLGNMDIGAFSIKNSEDITKIGVNFICSSETSALLEQLLDSLIGKNVEIELIPFYNYMNNDVNTYRELLKKKTYKDIVKIAPSPVTMRDLLEILQRQDCIVSMRYHCSLVSLVVGLPTLTISYDIHRHYPNKINYLEKLLGGRIESFSNLERTKSPLSLNSKEPEKRLSIKERSSLILGMRGFLSELVREI